MPEKIYDVIHVLVCSVKWSHGLIEGMDDGGGLSFNLRNFGGNEIYLFWGN